MIDPDRTDWLDRTSPLAHETATEARRLVSSLELLDSTQVGAPLLGEVEAVVKAIMGPLEAGEHPIERQQRLVYLLLAISRVAIATANGIDRVAASFAAAEGFDFSGPATMGVVLTELQRAGVTF